MEAQFFLVMEISVNFPLCKNQIFIIHQKHFKLLLKKNQTSCAYLKVPKNPQQLC